MRRSTSSLHRLRPSYEVRARPAFPPAPDGAVEAEFACPAQYQGYDGLLHGGITSSLLDGAMTNCLFAHGVVAVTGEMTVRFRHPIAIGQPLVVRARIRRSQSPLHIVEAEIIQGDQVKAKAQGKFMECRNGAARMQGAYRECHELREGS